MAYTNSPLVDYVLISPNKTLNRNHIIDTITIHCAVGQISVETLGRIFAPSAREASSNYGVGFDGRIGMYCEEKDRSWCSSSASNDNRAITIEVACDLKEPYAVTEAAYNSLIALVADICKRNNIKELKWENDKSLIGNTARQNMTIHRWFAATACPGTFLLNKMGDIASRANKLLGASVSPTPAPTGDFEKGSIVNFAGGKHYKSSSAAIGSAVKASKAKITAIALGSKHPYHLRAVNDAGGFISGVYGWVDASSISAVSSSGSTVTPTPTPTPTPAPSNNGIKKGAIVSIANGAKYYGTKTAVPQWVRQKQWIVMEDQKGDRVVINKSTDGKSAICSAISSAYLTVVSGGTVTAPATSGTATVSTIKKGSKVKVRNGAKTYTGGGLASFVYKTTYSVLEEPKGDRVVIGINGVVTAAVNKKDLTLV